MTRFAWRFGNWLAQIIFAFRIGYRDGSMLRPGTKPEVIRPEPYDAEKHQSYY